MAVSKGTGKKSTTKKASPGKGRGKKDTGKTAGNTAKKTAGKTGKYYSWPVLFWLIFAIVLFGIFIFKREDISKGFQIVQSELAARGTGGVERPPAVDDSEPPDEQQRDTPPAISQPTASQPAVPPAPAPTAVTSAPAASSQSSPSAATPPVSSPAAGNTASSSPAVQPGSSTTQPAASQPAAQSNQPVSPAAQAAPAGQERALYFIQVDRGGAILRVRVSRRFPATDSPMTDVLRALIAGPNEAEKQKGLISLIPPETRILSATVSGSTARINFSEDFQYNTYGVEGYAGQVRQIVFTATEFPNVRDVQILIEGRQIDRLGEVVWIGGPLSREMF